MKVDRETDCRPAETRGIEGLAAVRLSLVGVVESQAHLVDQCELDRLREHDRELQDNHGATENERNLLRRVCRRFEALLTEEDLRQEYESASREVPDSGRKRESRTTRGGFPSSDVIRAAAARTAR